MEFIMQSESESINVKPWYTTMLDFARNNPFLTGFLISGIITAAIFTGGTVFLAPPAVLATMAFVGGMIAFFPALLSAAAMMGGHKEALLGLPFIALGVTAILFPPVGLTVLGIISVLGIGTLGGAFSSWLINPEKNKTKANVSINSSNQIINSLAQKESSSPTNSADLSAVKTEEDSLAPEGKERALSPTNSVDLTVVSEPSTVTDNLEEVPSFSPQNKMM